METSLPQEVKRAVRSFCKECAGGWRRGAVACNDKNCPLWKFRIGHRFGTTGYNRKVREYKENG